MDRIQFLGLLFYWMATVTLYETNVEAGPMKRSSRMAREVYPEIEPENEANQAQVCIVGDVVYAPDEPVSSEQPCLKCKCQPPGVQCETIRCQKKPGCKAIHKPNKCCPDYQCECEYNGKFYTNGERLDSQPGGECKVCYCRGGEVKCAEVSCYRRPDCEEKTVPGQCCPKYDNCPPRDSLDRILPESTTEAPLVNVNSEIIDTWSLTELPPKLNTDENSKDTYENPSENRILDSTQDIERTTKPNSINKLPQINFVNEKIETPKITIHEIIPETPREIPITAPPSNIDKEGHFLIVEDANTLTNNPKDSEINDLIISDTETDSSEISEVFQQAPSVLRVGDKYLFINKDVSSQENDNNTQASIITVIGAEGLQRGEDSEEIHETEIQVNNLMTQPTTSIEPTYDGLRTNDLELKTSESTHILSLVKRRKPEVFSSTEYPATTSSLIDSTSIESIASSSEVALSSEFNDNISSFSEEPVTTESITSKILDTSTSNENVSMDPLQTTQQITELGQKHEITSTEVPLLLSTEQPSSPEQNPAYPPIPDVMTSPNIEDSGDSPSINTNIETETKILPEVLNIRSNKTVPQNNTNSEWLKAVLPDSILSQPATSDFENNTELSQITSSEEPLNLTTLNAELSTDHGEPTTVKYEIQTNFNSSLDDSEVTSSPKFDRSVESSENLSSDSGEMTTLKNNHESVVTGENASLESIRNITSEIADMVGEEENISAENITENNNQIDKVTFDMNESISVPKDVEMIDDEEINVTPSVTNIKPEKDIKSEKVVGKSISKRHSAEVDESDIVFRELDAELHPEKYERKVSKQEEEKEAKDVFKELFEETSTPKSQAKPLSGNKQENEMIQRVTDALAKLTLKGKNGAIDTSVIGVISDFFRSQSNKYDNDRK